MTDIAERIAVVRIAREWIGTRYQHGARLKGECCDCTFVALVYEEAGLVPKVPIQPYSSNAHLHRASSQYLLHVKRYAREINLEQVRAGDLVMFFIARDFSHAGIVTDWPEIIHADMAAGGVVPGRATHGDLARAKTLKFFTLW
jgi:cell wall-associated NlpC family hydrolase